MKFLAFTVSTFGFRKDYLISSMPSPQEVSITGPALEVRGGKKHHLVLENGAAGHGGCWQLPAAPLQELASEEGSHFTQGDTPPFLGATFM